ncbi:HEPN domain-containing protein [Sphaerospermopsis sp. LEGE 08334]|jgi:hypothetical protein|uniref:HEPN domain-containing protein n=1 Tax=Sphaerospermopsis sp. LEGE 08334 TaxID=1828651 RepID=UPI001882562E|nr:HEPN domain-containing protein [Sphaerospermopsis sp. LEGE 08334]MBE9055734.1 hypothetical protein [Sphaerospermopsis sp. LEGE 08334]
MTCERYLVQAQSNENAARSIESVYPDWSITMCFYAALHWVEYYACHKGDDISNQFPEKSPHDSRRGYVRQLAKKLNNRSLEKLYNDLESASRKSRYLEGVKYTSAIDYFQGHESEVGKCFEKLQQIKDILNKIK